MINTILTKLKTVAESITDMQVVFTDIPQNITKYPACIIAFEGHDTQHETLNSVKRTWHFSLKIIANLTDTNETSQQKVRSLASDLIDALDNDPKLDNSIDFYDLTTSVSDSYNDVAPAYVVELKYDAVEIFNRS